MALIDVPTLARRLADPDPPTVIDVRFAVNGPPGRPQYLEGHIPGASFLDVDAELCGPPGAGGRHPLPEPAALERALRRAGVRTGHPVVAYDGGDGLGSARLWWTLRWAGHDEVSVLDGGFAAWTGAGRPVEPGVAEPRPGDLVVRPGSLPVLDADGAAALARTGVLLDVRSAVRYRGEAEPIDPVAGHIPGAVNLPITDLDDGAFERAGVRPDTPVGAYCGSGIAAARLVHALHLAGRTDAALYVGSWSEWITDPARPVATGEGT